MKMTFRPIETWPGELLRSDARTQSPFKSGYDDTLSVLDRELEHLGAGSVVAQLAVTEYHCRVDGSLRANTDPEHPGVILSFDSVHGPLMYHTDAFDILWGRGKGWHANLRAIALGLEALRKVDRYGIGRRGEQYTGWSALPAGSIESGVTPLGFDQAALFIAEACDDPNLSAFEVVQTWSECRDAYFRAASKACHPDTGGTDRLFKKLQQAVAVLDAR